VTRLVLVVPADLDNPSGGNRYDSSLARALAELGTEVEQRPAPGRWPVATAVQRDRLAELLKGPDVVLVDGLLACGAPAAVEAAVGTGARVHVLVHGVAPDQGVRRLGQHLGAATLHLLAEDSFQSVAHEALLVGEAAPAERRREPFLDRDRFAAHGPILPERGITVQRKNSRRQTATPCLTVDPRYDTGTTW